MTTTTETATRKETATATAQAERMSYEKFLVWADEDTHAEWIDGEVLLMSPASKAHQSLGRFLTTALSFFVEAHGLGEVLMPPFQMKTGPDLPGREPDLLFVASENAERLRSTHLEGPADLVVEIISPDSRGRDRGEKFFEYEQGGVREYWLLDPLRRQAEFYALGSDGIYKTMTVEDGVFRSAVLQGLWIEVDWLWSEPLPPVMEVLERWGLAKAL